MKGAWKHCNFILYYELFIHDIFSITYFIDRKFCGYKHSRVICEYLLSELFFANGGMNISAGSNFDARIIQNLVVIKAGNNSNILFFTTLIFMLLFNLITGGMLFVYPYHHTEYFRKFPGINSGEAQDFKKFCTCKLLRVAKPRFGKTPINRQNLCIVLLKYCTR